MAEKIVSVQVRMVLVDGKACLMPPEWTPELTAAAESLRRDGEVGENQFLCLDRGEYLVATLSEPTLSGFVVSTERWRLSCLLEHIGNWHHPEAEGRILAWHSRAYTLLPDECREPGKPPRKLEADEVQGVNGEPLKLTMDGGAPGASSFNLFNEHRSSASPFRNPTQYARGLAWWSRNAPASLCIDGNGTREMGKDEVRDETTGKARRLRWVDHLGLGIEGSDGLVYTLCKYQDGYAAPLSQEPIRISDPGQRLRVEGFLKDSSSAVLKDSAEPRTLTLGAEKESAVLTEAQQEAIRALVSECWTEAVTLSLPSHGPIPNITESPEYAPVLASVFSGFLVARMAGYGGSTPGLFPAPFDCNGTGRTKEESDAKTEEARGGQRGTAPVQPGGPHEHRGEQSPDDVQEVPSDPGVGEAQQSAEAKVTADRNLPMTFDAESRARPIQSNLPPFHMVARNCTYSGSSKPRPACLPANIKAPDFTVIEGRTVWREGDRLFVASKILPWCAERHHSYEDLGPALRPDVPESLFRKAREWMGWEKAEVAARPNSAQPAGVVDSVLGQIEWGPGCDYPDEESAKNYADELQLAMDADAAPSPADGPAPVFGREWELVFGDGHDRPEWRLSFGPLLVVAFGPSAEDVELDWQDKPRPETEDGLFAIAMALLAAMPPRQVVAAMSEETRRDFIGHLLHSVPLGEWLNGPVLKAIYDERMGELERRLAKKQKDWEERSRAQTTEYIALGDELAVVKSREQEALARAEGWQRKSDQLEALLEGARSETREALARAEKAEADFANAADVGRRLEATLKRIPEPDHWAARNPGRADRLERCAMLAGKELGVDHEEAAPVEFKEAIQALKASAAERKQVDLGELREAWSGNSMRKLTDAVEKLLSEGGAA